MQPPKQIHRSSNSLHENLGDKILVSVMMILLVLVACFSPDLLPAGGG